MKKLSLLLSVIALSGVLSFAQGPVTFTLVTAPCDTNGVLVAHFATLPYPCTVQWNGGPGSACDASHFGVSGSSDTLFHYSGRPSFVYVFDSTSTISYLDTGSFFGNPPFTYTLSATPAPCPGASGSALATITGGTPPYSVKWVRWPDLFVAGTTNPAVLPSGTNPYGTTYFVSITDAVGCQFCSLGFCYYWHNYDTLTIYGNPTYSITATSTIANCTNGTASVTVDTGGTPFPPFTYLWSNGSTTATISGLMMGNYYVTVTDSHGCVDHAEVNVAQSITIGDSSAVTPTTCQSNDGVIITFPYGGHPPYTYLWSNSATTQTITGLASGYYDVTVTDSNGCIGAGYANVPVSTPITVTYSVTPSSCTSATGTATLIIAGGVLPYTDTFYTSPVQTGITATGLAAGTYNFKVTDSNGCIQTGSVVVPPVDVMSFTFYATPALCTLATGGLSVAVSGGVPPLSFLWSTGATSPSISGAAAGGYDVKVTDANGCVKTCCSFIHDESPVSIGFNSCPASCLFTADAADTAIATGGTAPYSWHWNTGATTQYIDSIHQGHYWVSVTDASGCYASNDNWVGYNASDSSCFCVIKGNIYYDINDNCTRDAGEPPVNHIQVHCSGMGYTYTDDSGNYSFLVPSGTYTITETVLAYYPLSSCQTNNIVVTATAATGCVIPVNFANGINPIHSISIGTWDESFAVPGNVYQQYCLITNQGTVTESNVLVGYKTDGQLSGAAIAPAGILVADSTNWYATIGGAGLSLSPGSSQLFLMSYNVPTMIPTGTSVILRDSTAYQAPMSDWLTDYSPWNNVNLFHTTIVSSFDPNFKEVYPTGSGPYGIISYADSNLQYLVHFQNTGTYSAQNITVIDTLDPNLDWSSLQPIYETAHCQISMDNNGVTTFAFHNINLPPVSWNPAQSDGMFTYSIKTKSGLPVGTQFRNSASIYFDYNAPVKTNTTLNTLVEVNSVPTVVMPNDFFTVYPNPTANNYNLSIRSEESCTAQMVVSDLSGRALVNRTISLQQGTQTIAASTDMLSSGIYFVALHINGKVQTQKLVVVR